MEFNHDTAVMIWLAALLAPPVLFGIWMRVKLMTTEEGESFLVTRELARIRAEHAAPVHLRDEVGEARGKTARASVDIDALAGSHGDGVAALLEKAIPFMLMYVGYAMILGLAGFVLLF